MSFVQNQKLSCPVFIGHTKLRSMLTIWFYSCTVILHNLNTVSLLISKIYMFYFMWRHFHKNFMYFYPNN